MTVEKGVPKLMADPVMMKRVLNNLITNAVQAMPNGGKLIINVFQKEEDVYISVQDTGAGIPEEVKPRLFTPLVTTKSKGQGFGLAVCKRLVEAHGGEITFESEVGKGSMFIVNIPMENERIS
jgi:signal transduction histidine kinase